MNRVNVGRLRAFGDLAVTSTYWKIEVRLIRAKISNWRLYWDVWGD